MQMDLNKNATYAFLMNYKTKNLPKGRIPVMAYDPQAKTTIQKEHKSNNYEQMCLNRN